MRTERTIRDELNIRIIRHYAVQGQLARLGWTAFQAGMNASGKNLTENELQIAQDAFYMGIQHCYSSMMQTIGEGDDEAEDFKIMESLTNELDAFLKDFLSRYEVFAKANQINLGKHGAEKDE